MYPQPLGGPHKYIKSAHLDRLRSVVGDSLALETAVLSLLAKYTKGAKRVVQSLDALDATTDLTPTCKNRVLVHLDNRLMSQEERSSVALNELHNMIDPNGMTALALQHLDNIVKSATEQADELDQCIAGCAADVSMEFGSVSMSGSSGGAVAVTASKVNCEVEIIKLKRQMEQSTERTRRAITSTAGTLANGNHDIGEKLMGADAEKAREEESKRNEELNQYVIVHILFCKRNCRRPLPPFPYSFSPILIKLQLSSNVLVLTFFSFFFSHTYSAPFLSSSFSSLQIHHC